MATRHPGEGAQQSVLCAARGRDPGGVPDAQPWVSRKSELWAHNTESYYEEAVTRQWNATTDIPWERLEGEELPEVTGKALSQLMTFLTEVEMIALICRRCGCRASTRISSRCDRLSRRRRWMRRATRKFFASAR